MKQFSFNSLIEETVTIGCIKQNELEYSMALLLAMKHIGFWTPEIM